MKFFIKPDTGRVETERKTFWCLERGIWKQGSETEFIFRHGEKGGSKSSNPSIYYDNIYMPKKEKNS